MQGIVKLFNFAQVLRGKPLAVLELVRQERPHSWHGIPSRYRAEVFWAAPGRENKPDQLHERTAAGLRRLAFCLGCCVRRSLLVEKSHGIGSVERELAHRLFARSAQDDVYTAVLSQDNDGQFM